MFPSRCVPLPICLPSTVPIQFVKHLLSIREAGKNTSTVITASRKRLRKGNKVVSDETVIYRVVDLWPMRLRPSAFRKQKC
jgi:hypothetical protein